MLGVNLAPTEVRFDTQPNIICNHRRASIADFFFRISISVELLPNFFISRTLFELLHQPNSFRTSSSIKLLSDFSISRTLSELLYQSNSFRTSPSIELLLDFYISRTPSELFHQSIFFRTSSSVRFLYQMNFLQIFPPVDLHADPSRRPPFGFLRRTFFRISSMDFRTSSDRIPCSHLKGPPHLHGSSNLHSMNPLTHR